MILLSSIAALAVLIVPTILAAIRFLRFRQLRTVDTMVAVMLLVYGVPLVMDFAVGLANPLRRQPDILDASVRIKANIVLIAGVLLLLWGGRTRRGISYSIALHPEIIFTRRAPRGLLLCLWLLAWLVLFLPIILVLLLSPDPSRYLIYGSMVARAGWHSTFSKVHSFIDFFNLAALGAFAFIFWVCYQKSRSILSPSSLLAILCILPVAYINGKRHFVVFIALIVVAVLLTQGRAKWSILLVPLCLLVFMVGYMALGGKGEYGEDLSTVEVIRGDLSRDYTLRYTVMRTELTRNPTMPYRGFTLVYPLIKYIPRAWWPNKPWPPPIYFTWEAKRMVGAPDPMRLRGAHSYGFLEEGLLNFGYLGLGVCYLVGRLTRRYDRLVSTTRPHYILFWYIFPLSVAFVFNVVLTVGMLLFIPAILFHRIATKPRNWVLEGTMENSYRGDVHAVG